MTITEQARLIGVARSTVRRWRDRNEVPSWAREILALRRAGKLTQRRLLALRRSSLR